jgi:hypothetical protein
VVDLAGPNRVYFIRDLVKDIYNEVAMATSFAPRTQWCPHIQIVFQAIGGTSLGLGKLMKCK